MQSRILPSLESAVIITPAQTPFQGSTCYWVQWTPEHHFGTMWHHCNSLNVAQIQWNTPQTGLETVQCFLFIPLLKKPRQNPTLKADSSTFYLRRRKILKQNSKSHCEIRKKSVSVTVKIAVSFQIDAFVCRFCLHHGGRGYIRTRISPF